MTLWFVFALMTAAAIFAVLWPLGAARATRRAGSDVAVYRDQLDEIERDRAAGLIGEARSGGRAGRGVAPADRGRGRGGAAASAAGRGATFRRRAAAVAALVALPAIGAALYLDARLARPAGPAAARAAPRRRRRTARSRRWSRRSRRISRRIRRTAAAGRWSAPVYMRLGRFDDAVKARRNALRLNGADAPSARPISARR